MSKGFRIYANIDSEVFKAIKNVDNYNTNAQKSIRKAMADGTKSVYDAAFSKAPHGTNNKIRAGLHWSYDETKNTGVVKSSAPHGHLFEFGTNERFVYPTRRKALKMSDGRYAKGTVYAGRIRPKPFMRPAIEQERPKIESEVKKVLE